MTESQLEHLRALPASCPATATAAARDLPASFSVLLHQAPEHQLCPGFLAPSLLCGKPLPLWWGWWLCSCQNVAEDGIFHLEHHRPVSWLAYAKTPSKNPQQWDLADSMQWLYLIPVIFHREELQNSGKFRGWFGLKLSSKMNLKKRWLSPKSRHACIVLWAVLGNSWLLLQKVVGSLGVLCHICPALV